MGARVKIQKMIEKKEEEINLLQDQISKAQVYIEALQESMRVIPLESSPSLDITLRSGSAVAKVRDVLRQHGSAMHISELVKVVGKPNDKKHRLSLAGSLASYVRKGQIFTRPEPNTFGLAEFAKGDEKPQEDESLAEDQEALEEVGVLRK